MAIVNRDLDVSQQKETFTFASNSAVVTGVTLALFGPMPYPGTVQSVQGVALGVSGAPQLAFSIFRPANGNTVIGMGISNMVVINGISNPVTSYSGLAASGSTLLNFQRGDIMLATSSVANTACTQLVVQMVVKKTQDIVSHNGTST
jgi:hypothetical protein